jgi:hypothetical protein
MAYRAYGVGQWPVERILYDAPAEFVIGRRGTVRLPYLYQYCEGHPAPRLLTMAARLS